MPRRSSTRNKQSNAIKKRNSKAHGNGRSPLNRLANRPVKPQSIFFEYCSFLLLSFSLRITIEIACIRKMTKLINRKPNSYYRNVSLEALTPVSEPYTETQEETVQDYTTYDAIIESLNLTDNMRIALECRIRA